MSIDNYLQEHLDAAITEAQKTNLKFAYSLTVIAGYHGLAMPEEGKELHEYHKAGAAIADKAEGSDNPIDNALSTEIVSAKITQKLSNQKLEEAHRLNKRSRLVFIGAFITCLIGIAALIYGYNVRTRANAKINEAQSQQVKFLELTHENARLNTMVNSLEQHGENLQQELAVLQESALAKEVEKWRKDYQELNKQFVNVDQRLNKVCTRKRTRFFASECKGRR